MLYCDSHVTEWLDPPRRSLHPQVFDLPHPPPHSRDLCYPERVGSEIVLCKPCAGVPHAWQGWRFALPLHPSRPSVDTWEPSEGSASRHRQGFTLGTHQVGLRAPWNPDQGASPLEPDEGLSRPFDHSPGLSRPGTHDQSFRALDDEQAAFEPLHPDEGMRPLDHAQDTLFLHLSRVSPRYRQWSGH